MKQPFLFFGCASFILFTLGASAQSSITNYHVQVVGGFAYLEYSGTIPNCTKAEAARLPEGIGFSEPGMIECSQPRFSTHFESHILPLGSVSPGTNFLSLSAYYEGVGYVPFDDILYTVPPSNNTMVSLSMNPNIQLNVQGISNVTYIVQASINLTNWTSVFTNVGGPFTWNGPVSSGLTNQYYRVSVLGY